MDISAEVAAIQAASQGSELRQPLVGALNKLNSGSLPAVTSSDAGKILKVGSNGWEVGEKSGYMPVPTDTMQITDNGSYDVTNYASANVHISGGSSAVLVPKTITQNGTYDPADDNADGYSEVIVNVNNFVTPDYSGYSYGYLSTAYGFHGSAGNNNYLNFFHVLAGHKYCLFVGEEYSQRCRIQFFSEKTFSDFEQYVLNPSQTSDLIYNFTENITGSTDVSDTKTRWFYTPSSNGAIVFVTSSISAITPAFCIDMSTEQPDALLLYQTNDKNYQITNKTSSSITIEFAAGNVNGVVVDTHGRSATLLSNTTNSWQVGMCTNTAVLPDVVTAGTGRNSYSHNVSLVNGRTVSPTSAEHVFAALVNNPPAGTIELTISINQ